MKNKEIKVEFVCARCGWKLPEGSKSRNCPNCGVPLVPKAVIPKNRNPNLIYALEDVWKDGFGACEKAGNCSLASDACKLSYNLGSPLPKARWKLCWAWKKHKYE